MSEPKNYKLLFDLMEQLIKLKETNSSLDKTIALIRDVNIQNEMETFIDLWLKDAKNVTEAGLLFGLYLFVYRRESIRGIGGMTDEMFAYSPMETVKAIYLYDEEGRFEEELNRRSKKGPSDFFDKWKSKH